MENELLLTSKQLEEERSRQRDLKKKVDEVEEEKGLTNQQYEAKIAQMQEDMEELKNRLVAVTRYDGFRSFCSIFTFVALSKRVIAAKRGKHVTSTKRGENVTAANVAATERGKICSRSQARENM